MGNYIEDAEARLAMERERLKKQKADEQAKAAAKKKAEQVHKEREKHANSILW